MPAKTDLSFRHLRERLTHLRTTSGPIPLIVVESPTGANVDAESIATAARDVLCGEPDAGPPMVVCGCLDHLRDCTVSVHLPRRPDVAWARFFRVAEDAYRVASPHLVASGLLDTADAGTGSWIVAVARTLDRLGPDSPSPVELAGGTARRWNPVGRFFVDEHTVLRPTNQLAVLLAGVTAHRYLVLDDVVEASIAVLDLLAGRLDAAQDGREQSPPVAEDEPKRDNAPRQKGEKGEKGRSPSPPAQPRKAPHRPRKSPDATKKAEAAWWRDRAHLDKEISDEYDDDERLDRLFELMMGHEFEVHLRELGAEEPPGWWPTSKDRLASVVRFKERWEKVSVKTWVKYVQRVDNDPTCYRVVAPRHRHGRHGNVEPPAEPQPATKIPSVDAVIRALEGAAEAAGDLIVTPPGGRGEVLGRIRRELAVAGLVGADANELLDLEPAPMVAELERRRQRVEKSQAGLKKRR